MSAYSALGPVAVAVYSTLNVAGLTTLATGGIFDTVAPQGTTFPYVLIEVQENEQLGGFGTTAGDGQLPEIEIRVHALSDYAGMKDAQAIIAKVIELLVNPPAVSGYRSHAIFNDPTVPLPNQQQSDGRIAQELVARFRLYVEQGS